jgi:single-strand DNA-binding protein
MNSIQLVGRLTKDPDIKTAQDVVIARFYLAVDRRFKKEGGQDADFPSIVAFGKTAEFVEKYFHKGMKVGVVGRLQTGSYKNKEGNTVYTTDVIAEVVEFCESKSANAGQTQDTSFVNLPDDVAEELPF